MTKSTPQCFRPVLDSIPTRELMRIDNQIHQRKVVGWTMYGGCYRKGVRFPGFTHLDLEGGGYLYFPEDVAVGPALDDAADRRFDVTEAREKLLFQRLFKVVWVKTGEGVRFALMSGEQA